MNLILNVDPRELLQNLAEAGFAPWSARFSCPRWELFRKMSSCGLSWHKKLTGSGTE
jgi:hypothetical protein